MTQNKYNFFYSFCFFFLCFLATQPPVFADQITVSMADDSLLIDGECSLREALINANAGNDSETDCTTGSDDSISIDEIVFAEGITTVCMDDTASGALTITSNLTITGDATNGTTIDGTDLTAGGTTDCVSDYAGNLFTITGAGIEVTLDHLIIKNGYNSAESGGGIIVNTDATLNLTNSTVSDNMATAIWSGGGIYNVGTLNIADSTITGNEADIGGGGIHSTGPLSVTDSTISNNDALSFYGGGIWTQANTTISNSTISGNSSADSGGGIYSSDTLTIANSTISTNTSVVGSAVYHTTDTLVLINSTLTGNTATNVATLIIGNGATGNIAHSTIANNSGGGLLATSHDAVYEVGPAIATSTTRILNSIFADNGSLDCMGVIDSFGYNIVENYLDYAEDGTSVYYSTGCELDYSNSGANPDFDFINQAIELNALAGNGGDTFTQAISTEDLAVDNGNCDGIDGVADTDVTTDQRGFARDANCDIGAFEYQADCGDDLTSPSEECDDGNTDSNDGCSATCQTEATWYADADGDTYGDLDSSTQAVDAPADFVADSTDCDDTDDTIHPDATETCGDTIDQDCNSEDLACDTDTDGDGTPDVDDDDDDGDGILDDEDDSPTGDDDDDDDGADGFTEAGGCGLNAKAGKVDYMLLSFATALAFLATRLRLRQNFSNPT